MGVTVDPLFVSSVLADLGLTPKARNCRRYAAQTHRIRDYQSRFAAWSDEVNYPSSRLVDQTMIEAVPSQIWSKYLGSSKQWAHVSIDLTKYNGATVHIKFAVYGGLVMQKNQVGGIFVDNVRVTQVCP